MTTCRDDSSFDWPAMRAPVEVDGLRRSYPPDSPLMGALTAAESMDV